MRKIPLLLTDPVWITSEYLHDQIILSAKYNDKASVCEKKSVIGFEIVHIYMS